MRDANSPLQVQIQIDAFFPCLISQFSKKKTIRMFCVKITTFHDV